MFAHTISTVELMDRFQILLEQENTTYHFNNYLSPSYQLDCLYSTSNNRHADEEARDLSEQKTYWRSKLCAWMYHIVDQHVLDRELVEISMSYMDRYLAQQPIHDGHGFQLVGMTSLYLAIKIFRHQGKGAALTSFVKLSQGAFTIQDFVETEQAMLDTLLWRMHPPTSMAFLELLMLFLPRGACVPSARRALYERIKFLLELCVTVQFFFTKKSSNIAIAAFIEVMEHKEKPNVSDVKYHVHFRKSVCSICGIDCESEEVLECLEAMTIVHRNAWHDLKEVIMMEEGCGEKSPTGTTIRSSVISP
jgi:lipoyl(octanoyl) transferase